MREYTQEELNRILDNHNHWIAKNCDGWEKMRANLYHADLSGTDLRDADLSGADLRGADLRRANLCAVDLRDADLRDADLRGANLRDADLRGADLRGADLRGADLRCADLRDADLRGADLRGADLRRADLSDSDLSDADLSDADLRRTNLRGADLRDADLRDADLRRADLRGAKNVPFIPLICPEEESFVGYKKASGYIVKIQILADAKRVSATTRKCRCDKAKVLGIYDYQHNLLSIKEVKSNYDKNFIYKVGEIVNVDDFDDNRWNRCSTGIHFFINFQEAVDY